MPYDDPVFTEDLRWVIRNLHQFSYQVKNYEASLKSNYSYWYKVYNDKQERIKIMDNKEIYEIMDISVIRFENADVITDSVPPVPDGDN